MKHRFLVNATAVLAAFIILDITFGFVMDKVYDNAKGGDTRNVNYINRHFCDSLAIFGSSRANHHYVPSLFEDSLGLTSYNCGMDGNGILLAYCLLNNIIVQGDKPSVIIYDFFPKFDLYVGDDRFRPLTRIRPFYKINGMKDIINDISPSEYIKLHLNTYRYNSDFIQAISDAVAPKQEVIKGYKPQHGMISTEFSKKGDGGVDSIDSLKVEYLHKFIDLCKNNSIKLIFVTSPTYFAPNDSTDFRRFLNLYGGDNLYYMDFRSNKNFNGNKELFSDPSHMNDSGAKLFSLMLVDSLRCILRE